MTTVTSISDSKVTHDRVAGRIIFAVCQCFLSAVLSVERTPSSGKVTAPLAITQHKTHALNRQFSRRTHSKQCYESGTPSAAQRYISSNPFQNHENHKKTHFFLVIIVANHKKRATQPQIWALAVFLSQNPCS